MILKNFIKKWVLGLEKITVYEDGLLIGNNKISWKDIASIREFSQPWMCQWPGSWHPMGELFLKDRRIFKIPSNFTLEGYWDNEVALKDRKAPEYFVLMDLIKKKVPVRKGTWIEWRLILCISQTELVGGITATVLHKGFPGIVEVGLLAGCIGSILGWIWEQKARREWLGYKEYYRGSFLQRFTLIEIWIGIIIIFTIMFLVFNILIEGR